MKKVKPPQAETVCGECLEPNGQHTRDCSKASGSMSGN